MKRLYYIPIIAVLSLMSNCADGDNRPGGGADWHTFRGNPALDGTTSARLPRDPVLLWSFRSDSPTLSSPVVDGGRTYWSDRKGHIRGVDADGEVVFDLDLATAVDAAPTISEGVLYIGRIDGIMSAIALADGSRVWDYETMGQISAPAGVTDFEGRRTIVFGSYDGSLYCVDALSGEKSASFESGYYLNGAAAIRDGVAVVGGCDMWLRVIDTRTGNQTDSLMLDSYIPASPALSGEGCYVGDHSGNVYEMIIRDGHIASHRKMMPAPDGGGALVSVPAVTRNTLYVLSDDRHLYAIDRESGQTRWKQLLKGGTGESSPVVAAGRVIACTKTGVVSIFDGDSGELLWEYDTGEGIVSSPAVIEGRFMILTTRGTLFCFGSARDKKNTDK